MADTCFCSLRPGLSYQMNARHKQVTLGQVGTCEVLLQSVHRLEEEVRLATKLLWERLLQGLLERCCRCRGHSIPAHGRTAVLSTPEHSVHMSAGCGTVWWMALSSRHHHQQELAASPLLGCAGVQVAGCVLELRRQAPCCAGEHHADVQMRQA